jgi:outer membrane protein
MKSSWRPTRAAVAVLLCVTANSLAHAEPDPRRTLSFAEAVDLTLGGSPDVRITAEVVREKAARVSTAKAQRLPLLRVEANVFVWDKALELAFMIPGAPSAPATTIRDQVTSTTSVSLVQPLSGLTVINKLIRLEHDGERVARADLDRARLDAAFRVAEAYVRVLQAEALRAIAERTVTQLDGQLVRARALATAGTLSTVDVLRLEAALATARQTALRAVAGETTARHALVLAIGLPGDTSVTVADAFPQAPPPIPWTEDEAVAAARRKRPELQAAIARRDQAANAVRVARANYLPNISAVATYQHAEGAGSLQPANAFFGGLTLQWNVWDWGKTGGQVDEASARRRQAELAIGVQTDQIVFEVRRRYVEAASAREAIAVAATGLAASVEAHRIQSIQFAQGAATTSDLLDAETELARAGSNAAIARFDYVIALAALARQIGELPAPKGTP